MGRVGGRNDTTTLFAGGGEMGERMRAYDWTSSSLGPVESWPQSLRTCVRIILTSRQPMFVWWGAELINLYNDAYKAIVGGKHPAALGQPASIVWKEIWTQVSPRAHSAMQRNEGTYDEALLLIMERNGYPEETYYTFSYSPVPNDQGGAGGIICANTDDTQRIIGERQLALLGELASGMADARDGEDACERAAVSLGTNPADLPFALLYLADHERSAVELKGAVGMPRGHPAAPPRIELGGDEPWPISEALRSQAQQLVIDVKLRFGALPAGAWPSAPGRVVVAPIVGSGETGRAGVLVVGLNPFRLYDDGYRKFIGLAAGQIAGSIANAEAYDQERKRAEALAEIDRAKTAFFSNVSHEFRTPLTLMLGPLEDAMNSTDRKISAENLETAYRNALRLLKLVNALLDFSRIEAGRADARYEPTDLSAFTADLASAFRSAIERADLSFQVELERLSEPIYVDHDMWEKIVLNLLSNALKFTFTGSICVSLATEGGCVRLQVSDTGAGIPSEELANVFKRFHRVQGTRSRTHEGSGIGLALVNELVRLHGGTVQVESQVGAGSTFTVLIPRGSQHLPQERIGSKRVLGATATGVAPFIQEAQRWLLPRIQASAEPDQPPLRERPSETASERILLADDNADMREYVSRLLKERWSVLALEDGARALAAARESPPDLVLTDVMMPNLDGFGVLRALRADERTRHVPVIMLSARAGEESRVEGLEAGADDYLVKPFSARELIARVSTHLQLARLRRAAEHERSRLYDVFMQAPVPIAVLSRDDLRFEVVNAAFAAIVDRTDLLGMPARTAFPELQQHDLIEAFERVLETGEPYHASELRVNLLTRSVSRELYLDVVARPLVATVIGAPAVVVVAVDLTEQVLARQKVEKLRAAAEQATRAKDEFLSTLSHELRTPLNAIIGWANLLRRGILDPERTARALETVERNAALQARLIEDMLDLARIEQGKLLLSVGAVDLVKVVEAAIDAVRPAAEAKGVRLETALDFQTSIAGDADRLQQVVWNLLSNAIKFTPKGGTVQIWLHREQSHVELGVADSGQGIEPDFLPFVFERFRQADPSFTRRAGGLGLGLAIVRSLVELHGGTVTAASEGKGRGARFLVSLPVAPSRSESVARVPASASAGKPFEPPPELKGLQILVVDDEPETRELLGFVLEQCEAHVMTAANAQEALALLESRHVDVLVSDIGMPDMDGRALIRRVRRLPAERGAVPALALTAYARSEDRAGALRAGFNMHMSKPIDPSDFVLVLAALSSGYLRRVD
jgi:signal transduction histidine kinase/PleD family two-component response regulator